MNYEKKYKEALERAKTVITLTSSDEAAGATITIFPELKESEDERHRKWILEYLYDGLRKSDEQFKDQFKSAIAWLEKQGEQKLINKVKSKIEVGDWIVTPNGETKQIEKVGFGNYYFTDKTLYNIIDIDNKAHFWTIQDAKDGDVLATDKGVFIYAKVLYNKPYAYCGVDKFGVFKDNCLEHNWAISVDNIYPATKERRELLFQKMHEAGYEWDTEKKELKKIEHKFKVGDIIKREEFSKEEHTIKKILDDCYLTIDDIYIPFKFEKYYILINQNQSWSEEDEKMRKLLIDILNVNHPNGFYIRGVIHKDAVVDWLKSLKPQKHWKPNEEQMRVLQTAIRDYGICHEKCVLETLYNNLKNL